MPGNLRGALLAVMMNEYFRCSNAPVLACQKIIGKSGKSLVWQKN
jgi:hypothetical protein